MTALGVPFGTTSAAQEVTTKSFSPASAMLGTLGSVGGLPIQRGPQGLCTAAGRADVDGQGTHCRRSQPGRLRAYRESRPHRHLFRLRKLYPQDPRFTVYRRSYEYVREQGRRSAIAEMDDPLSAGSPTFQNRKRVQDYRQESFE